MQGGAAEMSFSATDAHDDVFREREFAQNGVRMRVTQRFCILTADAEYDSAKKRSLSIIVAVCILVGKILSG